MYMDPEFNCLDKLIIGTDLNKTAARYHVPDIDRKIQVTKEQMRAVHGGIPCERITGRMLIELGKFVVMIINTFPPESSLSRAYSQRNIIPGKLLDFKN